MLNIKHFPRWHELWCLMNLSNQLYYLFIKCILSYTQISDEWEEMQNVAPGYRGRSGLMLPSEHRRLWRWSNGFFVEFCILLRNAPEGITDFKANKRSLDCIIWLNWKLGAYKNIYFLHFEDIWNFRCQDHPALPHIAQRDLAVSQYNVKWYYVLYYYLSLLARTVW